MIVFYYRFLFCLPILRKNRMLSQCSQCSHNKPTKKYSCHLCDYKCCRPSELSKHLSCKKHTQTTDVVCENNENIITYDCICGNQYNYKNSLARHKKTCSKLISPTINATNEPKQQLFTDEMFMELIKQNKELQTLLLEQQKMVMEQNNKICSLIQTPTNNNTNL